MELFIHLILNLILLFRNSLTHREINEQINDYEDENCLNQNTNTVIRKRKISNVYVFVSSDYICQFNFIQEIV